MKKVTLGVFVFMTIALLGVGMVAAFPFDFGKGKMVQELTEDEQVEMQTFQDSLQQAIEDNDFDSWKSLMESQLTEENFAKMVEMREQQEERRTEMEEQRAEFCEENDCPEFENGEFPENFARHRIMHKPFVDSDSE